MFDISKSIIIIFSISMIICLSVLQRVDNNFREYFYNTNIPEKLNTYTSRCKQDWSKAGPISEIIQQRLHMTMPKPNKIIAIKSNIKSEWHNSAWIKVFSIDAHMGYVVQMTSNDFPKFMEKKLEKSVAEQIFSRLTEGERRDITGKNLRPENTVYTINLSCEFLKLVYPTDSVQVDFIEGTVSDHDQLDTHTGLRILLNAHRFFSDIQAESETQTIQWDDEYFDYQRYLWRIKRNFKDLFFELPKTLQPL